MKLQYIFRFNSNRLSREYIIVRKSITNDGGDELNIPGRVEHLIRVLSLTVSVVELMRRVVVAYPLRTAAGLVFERPVERRVYGGQVETANGRASYAVAAR